MSPKEREVIRVDHEVEEHEERIRLARREVVDSC
jgi:hypothetical protein